MEPSELRDAFIELAQDSGISVRFTERSAPGDPPPASAACRVRGEPWVWLSGADPLDAQLDVLIRALRAHAGDGLESRYLAPAVRARLEASA
jgi:hypothetical protein